MCAVSGFYFSASLLLASNLTLPLGAPLLLPHPFQNWDQAHVVQHWKKLHVMARRSLKAGRVCRAKSVMQMTMRNNPMADTHEHPHEQPLVDIKVT